MRKLFSILMNLPHRVQKRGVLIKSTNSVIKGHGVRIEEFQNIFSRQLFTTILYAKNIIFCHTFNFDRADQSCVCHILGVKHLSLDQFKENLILILSFQVLRGHSDDVSRFVVKDGLVVSGGRDKTLVGWRQYGGRNYEFAFARR